VEIVELGTAPFDKYKVIYKVPSLRLKHNGQPVRVAATNVEITLPNGYPRVPPVARTLGGEVVFHPNFSATKICLMDDWAPGVQLPDLIKEIGEMLQWQRSVDRVKPVVDRDLARQLIGGDTRKIHLNPTIQLQHHPSVCRLLRCTRLNTCQRVSQAWFNQIPKVSSNSNNRESEESLHA
jgi:hypothetical protein